MKTNLIALQDLTYIFSSEFPADAKSIADLRTKIESIKTEMVEFLQVVEYMEKMYRKKIIMLN